MNLNKLRMILGATTVVMALALAPAASAQNSSVGTYGGSGQAVAGVTPSGGGGSGGGPSGDPTGTATSDSSGALPFTGLDASLLAGGGALLLLIGVGMAKLTTRRPTEAS